MLSIRAKSFKPSPTLAMDARAKAMKAEGIDIVNFGVGEPDFDTPDNIKEAAIQAIRDGFTKYTPVGGIDPLQDSIIEKFNTMMKDQFYETFSNRLHHKIFYIFYQNQQHKNCVLCQRMYMCEDN